ncbi:MAG: ABC transporter ATP-binding protein, partial [Candidatus Aureabacteria bacterium]|nr:ABC transporter ATP-binding protein [Candidatus Auribacterota bacterium]
MIQLKSVSEIYTLRFFHREKPEEEKVHALKDITLTIAPGECCNLIGENGSGKTTLLKVIAGLIDPTHGEVKINGRAGVLMEMGAGFHPDLTGRENVLAAAPLYGRTAEEIKTIMPEIEAFADLGKFFDAPIRTYSHGMYLRLAFSYAVHLDPGILCIDDIIAVGDELARQKCFEKIDEFKKAGKTILLVTHDLALAKKFAPRTLWMKNGELMRDGETDSVIQEYQQFCRNNNTLFVMEGWQHLFLEEKEDKHLLQFKENPLLCFENMKLSLQTENAVFESRPVEFQEWSRKFCRFVFPFESPHFQAEGILSLSGSSEFILEWFFENPIAILKEAITARLYLSVEENFSALTVQPGLFSNLEKHTRFRLHDEKRQTGLSGTLVPKMEIIQEQNSLVLESIFMPECYPAYRKRIGCLTAGLSDEKNPGEGNAPFVSIENPFLKLTSVGTGFSLKHDDKDLLAYEGVEILFEFLGKTWSSTQAEKMEARKETDSLIVVFS